VKEKMVGFLALVSAILATLVAIYSMLLPVWVYALLFATPREGFPLFWQGLRAPFERDPKSSLICFLLLSIASGVVLFWKRLSKPLAMYAKYILFIALILICVSLLSVLAFDKALYRDAIEAQKFATFKKTSAELFRKMGTPSVPDVAYFIYLDRKQIESLYAQIESEWLNKQRTLTESSGSSLKAGLNVPPASVEASSSGQQQHQIVQEPPKTTAEREAISFMRYASENGKSREFTTAFNWLILSLSTIAFQCQTNPPLKETDIPPPLNSSDIEKTKNLGEEGFDSSPERTKQINEELAKHNWKSELNGLLTQLPLFVVVKGAFTACNSPPPYLIHDYVGTDGNYGVAGDQFRPVQFRVTFPPLVPPPSELTDGKTFQATIFGTAVHGLDGEGIIEVRAIAVYN
jgi:hypothetical protein